MSLLNELISNSKKHFSECIICKTQKYSQKELITFIFYYLQKYRHK